MDIHSSKGVYVDQNDTAYSSRIISRAKTISPGSTQEVVRFTYSTGVAENVFHCELTEVSMADDNTTGFWTWYRDSSWWVSSGGGISFRFDTSRFQNNGNNPGVGYWSHGSGYSVWYGRSYYGVTTTCSVYIKAYFSRWDLVTVTYP